MADCEAMGAQKTPSEAFGDPVTLERAWEIVDAALGGVRPATESVPVRAARGRVLAAGLASRLALPPFDKSAVDGYAIREGDRREEYRLLETVAAGRTPTAALEDGTTVKVMTGAPVPPGTGRVVMREFAEECGGTVRILRRAPQTRSVAFGDPHGGPSNVCLRGQDVRAGDAIMPAGRTLDAVDVANLVACGVTEVPVARAVRLAIVSTGDEIVDEPAALTPGKIMNANGPLLACLAAAGGLEVALERTVPDCPDATAAALRDSLAAADVVALSGGVSVGDFDFVLAAMQRVGLHVRFTSLGVQPGRPTVFATAPAPAGGEAPKVVFGLPGNPVSVCVMFNLFVLRAAAWLCGARPTVRWLRLPLATDYRRRRPDRMGLVPARLVDAPADGLLPTSRVEPLEYHGSAHLLALRDADGLFQVPLGVAEMQAGQIVTFMPLAKGRP